MHKLPLLTSRSILKKLAAKDRVSPAGSFNSTTRKRIEVVLAAAADAPEMGPVLPELVKLLREVERMDEVIRCGDEIIEALVCEIADLTGVSVCDVN